MYPIKYMSRHESDRSARLRRPVIVARNSSSIELNVQVPILLRMCACRSGPAVKYILKNEARILLDVQARCDVSDRPAHTRGPVGLFVTRLREYPGFRACPAMFIS